ncbi:MAG: AsmA family protein, partial [Desulfobacterales bacterium]
MRWKWIVGIGVLLIIILIAGIYVYLHTYDYNKLKPLVARMVEDATGRELHLGGEINLAVGFAPSLVVTDVAFANAAWGSQPQMIKIRRLEAQVRLIPLLFKNMELKHIGLADVDVLLETDSKGQGNWDFTGVHRSQKSFGFFETAKLDIDSIRIENLSLVFRKGKDGSEKRFTVARLDVVKQATGDEQKLDLRTEYKGQPAVFTGRTGLIRNLFAHRRFPLQLSGKLANTAVMINGEIDDALNIQGIDAEIRLTGKNLEVLGHVFDIQLPKTKAFDVTAHLKGSKDSMRLDQIKGSLSGSGVDIAISGTLDNLIAFSGVDLKLKSSGHDLTVIQSVIGEKLPATDQFEIQGRLTGSAEALALNEAQGSARRGSMSLTFSGRIARLLTFEGIHLTLKASGKEVAEIGQMVETKLPELGPFDASGQLSGSAKAISLSAFSAVIDQSDFKGLAKVEFFKRPKITLRLESSLIDFTALMKTLEKDEQRTVNHNQHKRRLFS